MAKQYKNDTEALAAIESSGMKLDERVGRLFKARSEIDAIRAVLNTNRHECAHCGLTVMDDFGDAQLAERMASWVEKIDKEIQRLIALRKRVKGS